MIGFGLPLELESLTELGKEGHVHFAQEKPEEVEIPDDVSPPSQTEVSREDLTTPALSRRSIEGGGELIRVCTEDKSAMLLRGEDYLVYVESGKNALIIAAETDNGRDWKVRRLEKQLAL